MICKFYSKYIGIKKWHDSIIKLAVDTGQLITPTGRVLVFKSQKDYRGELRWPITQIKNYPVQSLGADIMSLARVSFQRRFMASNVKGVIVNTIHDSIVTDCHESELEKVTMLFHEVFKDLPANFEKIFGIKFNLPLICEVSSGNNMAEG